MIYCLDFYNVHSGDPPTLSDIPVLAYGGLLC
jgi:hypothetical protein